MVDTASPFRLLISALGALGIFDADDPSVPEPVRRAVGNEIRPDETLFLARP